MAQSLGCMLESPRSFKKTLREFPGGAVVKNPPAHAEDTGSRKIPHAVEQLSLGATITEPAI